MAAPGPGPGKSFQKALLGADWPRRTRSRGAAANERRGPRALGRGRGPEVRAAPPLAAAASAAAARPRRPSQGKWGAVAAAGGGGSPGTATAPGKLSCPAPARSRDPRPPLCRDRDASLARLFPAAGTPPLPGAGLQDPASLERPFLTLCFPTLVFSRPAPRPCQLSLAAFPSFLDFLGLSTHLVPSPRRTAALPT